jgi:cardiolipin synthase C
MQTSCHTAVGAAQFHSGSRLTTCFYVWRGTRARAFGWVVFLAIFCIGLGGCASLPANVDRPVSTALADPQSTPLGRSIAVRAAASGTRNDSAFALVSNAQLAFTSRMTLIKAAQKTLDIQYYAIHADDTTERLFEALREAAARGVRIRILLDDFNTSGKNAAVLKLAFVNNIDLRLFNPLPGRRDSLIFRVLGNLHDLNRMQRRMHNKVFVADNAVAITGGRNLGETYFGQSSGTNFIDVDVLAAGRIARDLSRSFDQYWNNPKAYPVQTLMTKKEIGEINRPVLPPLASRDLFQNQPDGLDAPGSTQPNAASAADEAAGRLFPVAPAPNPSSALPDSTDLRKLNWVWAPSVMLVDKPDKVAGDADSVEEAGDTTVDGLLQLMQQARKDLIIVSPYFVPGDQMMQKFAQIRQRGVRVRVLTNSLASNDAPAAHVGYSRYREALIALGVEVYEMRAEQPGTVGNIGNLGGSMGNLGSAGSTRGSSGEQSDGASGGSSRASLHAKVVVMDERIIVVGSMNLDLRSQLQNSEVALVIRNRALSAEATRLIEPAMRERAYRVEQQQNGSGLVWRAPQGSQLPDATSEPDVSLALRMLVKLIGPFAPDEML